MAVKRRIRVCERALNMVAQLSNVEGAQWIIHDGSTTGANKFAWPLTAVGAPCCSTDWMAGLHHSDGLTTGIEATSLRPQKRRFATRIPDDNLPKPCNARQLAPPRAFEGGRVSVVGGRVGGDRSHYCNTTIDLSIVIPAERCACRPG